jgi:hypothetical protein
MHGTCYSDSMPADQGSWSQIAFSRVFCVVGILAVLIFAIYPLTATAAEDAIILQQFSRNLAETGVISFIPGGPRAEGATDFLWMLYIAAGLKLHIAASISTAIANVSGLLGLAHIFLRLAKRRPSWVNKLSIIGLIALTPQALAALEGFSVLPFALVLAALVLYTEQDRDVLAALSALILCLLRPDGVVFAVPLLLRKLWLSPDWARVVRYCLFFGLPGLAYFLWRWSYFGNFLPLPFLVKSDTSRFLGVFDASSIYSIPYLTFCLILLGAGLGKHIVEPKIASLIITLVVIPTLFYSTLRLDQNIDGRFYTYLPLAAALVTAMSWQHLALSRTAFGALAALSFLLLFALQTAKGAKALVRLPAERRRFVALAQSLSPLSMRGTMLVSEAGLFPYYSRWAAYDAWGLNTPSFAKHFIQADDVVHLHPDLVLLHSGIPNESCSPHIEAPVKQRSWAAMMSNVRSGVAEAGGYDTWRLPYWSTQAGKGFLPLHANPGDSICWYVSRSYPHADEVEGILRRWNGTPVGEGR